MDLQADTLNTFTPAAYNKSSSYWKSEDSGYLSYTPGSILCPETPRENENLDTLPSSIRKFQFRVNGVTSSVQDNEKRQRNRKTPCFKSTPNDENCFSPSKRRGLKRSYEEDYDGTDSSFSSMSTPTSIIARGIQKLHVNELKFDISLSPLNVEQDNLLSSNFAYDNSACALSYPTTPVKKLCRPHDIANNRSPLSSPLRPINNLHCPPKRSARKLTLFNNSLPGEVQSLNSTAKPKGLSKVVRSIFKSDKFDIIKGLTDKRKSLPAIEKILQYLSDEDVYNFSLVSPVWSYACDDEPKARKRKLEYEQFLNNTKENQLNNKEAEAIDQINVTRERDLIKDPTPTLRDIYNVIDTSKNETFTPTRSPPTTPKSMRFKKFIKAASQDLRTQLSCVRCYQPAKVNEETSGEEWVECTRSNCSYQFCRYCKRDRHPGKSCIQCGTSPTKIKKNSCRAVAGTKKSKSFLRRL